jgi:hypothetical protein
MSAVSQQQILDRLSALQITHSGVIEHAAVKNAQEWRAALESSEEAKKAGGDGWELTKTVSRCFHRALRLKGSCFVFFSPSFR